MFAPISATERMLFSTIRIETTYPDGSTGVGTGFYFAAPADGTPVPTPVASTPPINYPQMRGLPLVVTNKHVVQGAVTGKVIVHEGEIIGDMIQVTGKTFAIAFDPSQFIFHPSPDVDLCGIPFGPIMAVATMMGRKILSPYLTAAMILSDDELLDVNLVEDILMYGYPLGIWDTKHNLPVLRKGITSSHPSVDWEGKSWGLVDMACFPGSSGSPIFLYSAGAILDKKGPVRFGIKMQLLGVLFAGPVMNAEGKITIKNIPTVQTPISLTPIMIHLGYYVKAKEVFVLARHIAQLVNSPPQPPPSVQVSQFS